MYALCASLPDTELAKTVAHSQVDLRHPHSHRVWRPSIFVPFTGNPSIVPRTGADLFGTFSLLRAERAALDHRILVCRSAFPSLAR